MSAHPRPFRRGLSPSALVLLALMLVFLPATPTVGAAQTQWTARTLAILREDAALPAGLTEDFPGLVDRYAGKLVLPGQSWRSAIFLRCAALTCC